MLKMWELIDKDQTGSHHSKVALSPGLRVYPLLSFFP